MGFNFQYITFPKKICAKYNNKKRRFSSNLKTNSKVIYLRIRFNNNEHINNEDIK
jgi:hypothetical protein